MSAPRTLGINGLGRIGKLTLWYHLGRDDFDRFVVNVAVRGHFALFARGIHRQGQHLRTLHRFLAVPGQPDVTVVDEKKGLIRAHGKEIVVLREARDPRDIPWRENGVSLVVDCTGNSRTLTRGRRRQGSLRGHLARERARWCRVRRSRASVRASLCLPIRLFSSMASIIWTTIPEGTNWSQRLRAPRRRLRT